MTPKEQYEYKKTLEEAKKVFLTMLGILALIITLVIIFKY